MLKARIRPSEGPKFWPLTRARTCLNLAVGTYLYRYITTKIKSNQVCLAVAAETPTLLCQTHSSETVSRPSTVHTDYNIYYQ